MCSSDLEERKKEFKEEPKLNLQSKPKEILKPEMKGNLAKAIEEAVKGKNGSIEEKKEIKIDVKNPEIKKEEKISLQELSHGEKNKNKEASPEKMNALREAIEKAKKEETEKVEDKVEYKTESKKENQNGVREVPEEMLRKILKGE